MTKQTATAARCVGISVALMLASLSGSQLAHSSEVRTWIARESDRLWFSVASSADGMKLAAVAHEGQIYTSTDGGVSWSPRENVRTWYSVASSADGNKLAAVIGSANDFVYTSTDAGITWTPRGSSGNRYGITSSSDGNRLTTHDTSGFSNTGSLNTSDDGGLTWADVPSVEGVFPDVMRSFACSADGSVVVGASCPGRNCGNNGDIYISRDFGATWSRTEDAMGSFVAVSADGNKLVVAGPGGPIYTSTDAGSSWIPRESLRNWKGVASSSDGTKLVAVVAGGQIYVSDDSGETWTAQESNRNWSAVASSADGSRLVATVADGQIYTSGPPPCQLTFQGFLAPIGGGDASGGAFDAPVKTFKQGSTIPVKFALFCEGSPVLEGVHTLQVIPFSTATLPGVPIDATPQDEATSGNAFRLSDQEWHFNLDTKAVGMFPGIWRFEATLANGSVHFVWVQLK